jgi:D-sedoheptulose 7-phosphate isomerase
MGVQRWLAQRLEASVAKSLATSEIFAKTITEHVTVIRALIGQEPVLARIALEMVRAIAAGKKVLWCGNGGSAADAQHLAAELVGRFRRERRGLPSIALTTDTSILTAIANDYGYEEVFRRQVAALCSAGDVLIGISTSGNSQNVCLAIEAAGHLGAFTAAFTGAGGGAMAALAQASLRVPSNDTARIQEAQIFCGHMLCELVEVSIAEEPRSKKGAHPR